MDKLSGDKVSVFQKNIESISDENLEKLIHQARQLTRQRFGHTIQLYAPLYLSNECVDTCTYCGFSRENKLVRKTLTPEEVEAETQFLIQEGFQHLLLVAGEHPKQVSPEYLEIVLQKLRPRLASLAIEVAPFQETIYRRLIEKGLDSVVLYQETYAENLYTKYHLGGPKKNFAARILAPEEALKAGIRQLGMGILLGLAPWQEDALALVRHVSELKKKYWQAEFTISLPRLRSCASISVRAGDSNSIFYPVSNRDFLQLIAALRIALPDVGLVLSTRESASMRDFLIGMGITKMSAGSRTEPGGYLKPDHELKQFEIEDHRSPREIAKIISQKGYDPVWKDWENLTETL